MSFSYKINKLFFWFYNGFGWRLPFGLIEELLFNKGLRFPIGVFTFELFDGKDWTNTGSLLILPDCIY